MIYQFNNNRFPLHMSFVLAIFLCFIIQTVVNAASLPSEPILRIETGMHTAAIRRIGVDAQNRFLVTSSWDKTARMWELETGNLLKILRPPIGEGHEGKIYAVAISPDGSTVAAGGYTEAGTASNNIYLFDRVTGALTGRITGLPYKINYLTYSRDGRFLAAALKSGGVRVFLADRSQSTPVGEDSNYGSNSYWADFAPDGRLITTCYDGFIRLYAPIREIGLNLLAKVEGPGGKQPFSALFSPDGSKVAVGFSDSTKVDILSATDLSHLYSPSTASMDNGNLGRVSWSDDGDRLFAAGMYNKGGSHPILAWTQAGKGSIQELSGADNNIMHILPLNSGGIVFGSADPAFGVIQFPSPDSGEGKRTLFQSSANADHRDNWEGFRLSHDGKTVQFSYGKKGKSPAVFDTGTRNFLSNPAASELGSPDMKSLNVTDWKYTVTPKLNGKPLTLQQYEWSRSLAVTPSKDGFLLGTEWLLRFFDASGAERWKAPAPDVTWAVNIAKNGKIAAAAFGDGTIRWYRISDGKELLAFFPHNDRKRWVLWTPSGYYAASPGGEDLIGWHVNNGADREADFFPCARFRSIYARPDVIEKVLSTQDEAEALRLANQESGRKQQEVAVAQMLPPVVTIQSPQDGTVVSSPEIRLGYSVRIPSGEPVTLVKVLIDGRQVTQERGVLYRPPSQTSHGETTHDIQVQIPEQDCEVSLIAENRFAASTPATIKLVWQGQSKPAAEFTIKPKLYVLAIGVGKYRNEALQLAYPAKDAADLAGVLEKQNGKLYRDVVTRVITNEKASRDGVLQGLEWIEKETTSKDVVMIFLAGHGVNDRNGDFHFIPHDGNPDQIRSTGVPYSILRDTVTRLPGKVIFFLDTCHSGNVMGDRRSGDMGDLDRLASDLASAENGVVVFTSSTGRQYSLESPEWNNGAFTKALVEGLDGKAEYEKKGYITINMLDLYVSERVKELTDGRQTPMSARPKTIRDFPIAVP